MLHQQGQKNTTRTAPGWVRSVFVTVMIFSLFLAMPLDIGKVFSQGQGPEVYLPAVFGPARQPTPTPNPTQPPNNPNPTPAPASSAPIINAPFYDVSSVINDRYGELAVAWFGKVTPNENSTDVRLGYNRQKLYIQLSTYDRQLWYSEQPTAGAYNRWDAASVYLVFPNANNQTRQIRLDAMLNHWESRSSFQTAFEYTGGRWAQANIPFTSTTAWRGEDLNAATEDRGWIVTYEIPFSSLGYASPPASGAIWKMGLSVHDQDSGANGAYRTSSWPAGFAAENTTAYGQLRFGIPGYTAPAKPAAGTVKVQQGVKDGSVGGYSTCGAGMNYWSDWGNKVYNSNPENQVAVIQNQGDVADWPCFSRYYVTFPMASVPSGKVILSATLTLHHFGNSQPSDAQESYIQVLRVGSDWQESTLAWNNAPQAIENYTGVWVNPLRSYPGVPGVAYNWDVTRAVAQAYSEGNPLRLALYDSDWDYHSGKYFHSAETLSWSTVTPPTLTIVWGNP